MVETAGVVAAAAVVVAVAVVEADVGPCVVQSGGKCPSEEGGCVSSLIARCRLHRPSQRALARPRPPLSLSSRDCFY